MTVPHPIPYQGSKRNLASKILAYLPEDVDRLIEPFAGSAALSIAAASGMAQSFILNDINAPLMGLLQTIILQPDRLGKRYEQLWQAQLGREQSFYNLVRERFNRSYRPHYFLYLLARCVKSAVRYNSNGEFNQSPDKRRKGKRPATMQKDILSVSHLLDGKTRVVSVDYEAVCNLAKQEDVIYMDPPYQGVCSTRDPRYLSGVEQQRFIRVLQNLNERQISFMVSYDGRTGNKTYGDGLPEYLNLKLIELDAGRSSQSTLLGGSARTIESLYLSPALVERISNITDTEADIALTQLELFGDGV